MYKRQRQHGFNVVIVDTAGRLAVDEAMMQEITAIKQAVKPGETLFVVDSMTGQDAVNTAREFNQRLDFDGVVLTKLDGDTRGGAAISIRAVVNKPLKFISSGEKMDAIQVFHPERMADRILGMGDVVSLVERAQEQYDEEEARRCLLYTSFLDKNVHEVYTIAGITGLLSAVIDNVPLVAACMGMYPVVDTAALASSCLLYTS